MTWRQKHTFTWKRRMLRIQQTIWAHGQRPRCNCIPTDKTGRPSTCQLVYAINLSNIQMMTTRYADESCPQQQQLRHLHAIMAHICGRSSGEFSTTRVEPTIPRNARRLWESWLSRPHPAKAVTIWVYVLISKPDICKIQTYKILVNVNSQTPNVVHNTHPSFHTCYIHPIITICIQ